MPSRFQNDSVPRSLNSTVLSCVAVFAAVFAVFALLWARYINPYYFPHGDSFALLVNSTPLFHPAISSWFLHGFRAYFDAYPDISLHATNFIRPGVNATFYLGWFIHGPQWSHYLLTTYAIIGLIAATTFFLASYVLKLSRPITLLATICVAVAPSIDSRAIFDPTFAFDLLAGLFVLIGVTALTSDALVLSWTFFSLATFTKETALFAPVLAAAILFIRRSDKPVFSRAVISASYLLPLAAWLGCRWYAFASELGLYVFLNPSSHGVIHQIVVRIILGLLTWPLATVVYWGPLPAHLLFLQKLSSIVNGLFWCVLAAVLFRKIMKKQLSLPSLVSSLRAEDGEYATVVLSLFCIAILIMPVVLDVPRRFGGVFYPLFVLCMAMVAARARGNLLRFASVCMIVVVGASGALLIFSDFHYQTAKLQRVWAMARAYVSVLSKSAEPVLFSIDDLTGSYASNQYVQTFSGYQGQLIRVNDLKWDFFCEAAPRIAIDHNADGNISITSIVPKRCGAFAFDSVFPPLDAETTAITRDLPVGTLQYNASSLASRQLEADTNRIHIDLEPAIKGASILLPEVSDLRYRKVPLDLSSDAAAR